MHIELRTHHIKLPRALGSAWARKTHIAFERLAHRVARIVLRIRPAASGARTRECVVEVHMTDGHVEIVEERHRKLAALVRRALQRAWRAAARWFTAQAESRPVLRLAVQQQAGSGQGINRRIPRARELM